MVTITDVAEAANVSIATVSRVLNNDKKMSVSIQTRQRILEISKKLGYVPVKQRNFDKGEPVHKTHIGIIMYCSQQYEWDDVYFMSIRKGIEKECNRKGLTIKKIFHLGNGPSLDNSVLRELDGVIFVGGPSELEEALLYRRFDSNIVYVNHLANNGQYDHISIHFKKATQKVLYYLFSLGHKQIGYIGGIEHRGQTGPEIENPRKVAFQEIMMKEGLYYDEFVQLSNGFLMHDGYQSMKKILQKGTLPTAYFVASDAMAIGVIRALHEVNINVPGDVSIVSFNDIDMAEYTQPSLTTIKVHTEEMGKYAVKMLLDRFEGRDIPINVLFPTNLIIRESTKALNVSKNRNSASEITKV
ncbi:LacI family DNA-binding transcriptional regulator [Halalkalibacter hemicellulosilyticus]|uniref:MSM (Multiple sugar metabolism) operon regulatory protein n=1 Tax=Halalkalibacter hemicellulosilyticusJCM 9152 TaxID=1236971 RepID=W4QBI4_9BACI|nr:LacI family DNA-binding transcriptional regulator [Halalkalibacter hemicellulosilyticus]GAE29401.1 MSM (multiple sugar metabolism) operon regulatory protein [Halalkalibacter hemicellulosilyticusJCM 9152]